MSRRPIRIQIDEIAADGALPPDLAEAVNGELRRLVDGEGGQRSTEPASVAQQIAAAIHQQLPPSLSGDGS